MNTNQFGYPYKGMNQYMFPGDDEEQFNSDDFNNHAQRVMSFHE